MATAATIEIGQTWKSVFTGNRFRVVKVDSPYVTVEAMDGGHFGNVDDACYSFHLSQFDAAMRLCLEGD